MQVGIDHPSTSSGFDILNLSTRSANAFESNVCLTSVNAPCPSVGPSLTASPNPVPVTGEATVGQTTISWSAPGTELIEIHIGSPDGELFTVQGNRGSIQTGPWVSDGLTFYLQDVTGGNSLTADYTVATLVVRLQRSVNGLMIPRFLGAPPSWAAGAAAVLLLITLFGFRRRIQARRLWVALGSCALLVALLFSLPQIRGQSQPSSRETAATLDHMIAAHKTQEELARYVFEKHGCKDCHTVGRNGKLGFTSRGQQVSGDFEGCIRLLTDVNRIAQAPENRRSDQQRQKAARFRDFGCTFCHQITPGKAGLTEVGAKLTRMHLGCVDVEKLIAGSPAPR